MRFFKDPPNIQPLPPIPPLLWWVLLPLIALNLLPIWRVTWLPMGDLGGHLELMDIMARYSDPHTLYSKIYSLPRPFEPNTTTLLFAKWLPWLGAVTAARLLITAYVVGLPLSMLAVARAFGRSPWLCLFAVPLTWNALFASGFINYLLAVPLLLLCVAHAVRWAQVGGWPRLPLLTVSLALLYITHIIAFSMGLAMVAFVIVLHVPHWRFLWRLVALAPVVPPIVLWLKRKFIDMEATETGHTFAGAHGQLGLSYLPRKELIAQTYYWGPQFFRDNTDEIFWSLLGSFWLVALLWGLWQRAHRPYEFPKLFIERLRDYTAEIVFICCIIAYFVIPSHMNEMWIITERVVLNIFLFATLLPRLDFTASRRWLLLPIAVVSAIYPLVIYRHFVKFEREELGSLPAAMQILPEKTKLAYVMHNRDNNTTYMGAMWHLPRAMFALTTGGLVDDCFAVRPYTPVQYKRGQTPMQLEGSFWYNPHLFDYDFVLMRTPYAPTEALAQAHLNKIFSEGQWWLFAVDATSRKGIKTVGIGGGGGTGEYWDCAHGSVLAGADVQVKEDLVRSAVPLCRPITPTSRDGAQVAEGRRLGERASGADDVRLLCPHGQYVIGFFGRSALFVDKFGFICSGSPGPEGAAHASLTVTVGGAGGKAFERNCAAGTVGIGMQGSFGEVADQMGLECRALPSAAGF